MTRIRFSIRTLFILTACVAIIASAIIIPTRAQLLFVRNIEHGDYSQLYVEPLKEGRTIANVKVIRTSATFLDLLTMRRKILIGFEEINLFERREPRKFWLLEVTIRFQYVASTRIISITFD
jgi:hypothetical protein